MSKNFVCHVLKNQQTNRAKLLYADVREANLSTKQRIAKESPRNFLIKGFRRGKQNFCNFHYSIVLLTLFTSFYIKVPILNRILEVRPSLYMGYNKTLLQVESVKSDQSQSIPLRIKIHLNKAALFATEFFGSLKNPSKDPR